MAGRPEYNFISVFKEVTDLPVGKFDSPLPTGRQFEEATSLCVFGTGDGPGSDQIAGPEIAATRRVVCDHLCRSSIEVLGVRLSYHQPWHIVFAHLSRL